MDAIRSSSKRKHRSSSPSHPLSGVITRSRTMLSLRRNRSGRVRSDPGRRKDSHYGLKLSSIVCRSHTVKYSSDDDDDMLLISDLCKKRKLNQGSPVIDDDEPSQVLIKDLRARRVYSPQSVGGSYSNSSENVYPEESRVGSSCRYQKTSDSGVGSASNIENNCRTEEISNWNEEIGNLGEGFPSDGRSKDETNSILCSIVKEYRPDKDDDLYSDNAMDTRNEKSESPVVGFPYIAHNLNHINHESFVEGNSNELPKLTTPPDVEICGNLEVNEGEGKQVEGKYVQLIEIDERNAEEAFCPKADNKNYSVLESKSVLRSRLQRKLFKNPGSISYRRMLPFLMNVAKDDSGSSKLSHYQNDVKVIDAKQFQFSLSSQSQEASKDTLKTDSFPVHDTVESRALEDNNDLSDGNESNLTSYQDLPELPMKLSAKEVAHDYWFVPTANEYIENVEVRDVANAVDNENSKQDSKHNNVHGSNTEANDGGGTSEKICVLNKECLTPSDDICGNSEASEDEGNHAESIRYNTNHGVNSMDLTRSPEENGGGGSCPNATKGKEYVLKSKSIFMQVLRPCLQRKLFKTPGSVSYKRLLPFLMDIVKDDSGSPKLNFNHEDERGKFAKISQRPLQSQSQVAPVDELKTYNFPRHDTVESNAMVDNTLVDPANELSHGNQPKLTSSQILPEFPVQLDVKEVVQQCVSAPSVYERTEKDEIHCKDKSITLENPASKEKSLVLDSVERMQFLSLEKSGSVGSCAPEIWSLNHMDPIRSDALMNETGSHANSRSCDAVLNHVHVSTEEPKSASDAMILEDSEMAENGGYTAEIAPKGKVCGLRMSSKGSSTNEVHYAGKMRDGSEPKTTLVLNPSQQIELLKHSGSFSYRRLLPFLKNITIDNSCATTNDHYPKHERCLGQMPPPISSLDYQATPIKDQNGCVVSMENCTSKSGTRQKELPGPDGSLNNNSQKIISSAHISESQCTHDSCKLIQLQDQQVLFNGKNKLNSSPDSLISVVRIDSPVTPSCPIINEVITREDATSALHQTSVNSEVEGNRSSNGEKPLNTDECCHKLFQTKALEQLTVPAVGFKKGILKRNPRGCRGLCTCLNCASFRLHAERAFEFSRNQLLDAEEVVLHLMKELSHLRNTLEKSTDGANDPTVDENQVKEACSKAFAAEQLAKDRLSQMNDDLNVHCKITCLEQPRVRFANYIEEKVIPPGRCLSGRSTESEPLVKTDK